MSQVCQYHTFVSDIVKGNEMLIKEVKLTLYGKMFSDRGVDLCRVAITKSLSSRQKQA